MPGCPACGRPVAVARASCLYCGALLPEALRPAAGAAAVDLRPSGPAAAPAPDRVLVVLDLEGVEAQMLAVATGRSLYDASHLVRRGGLQLHGVLSPAEAVELSDHLREAGLTAHLVPEVAVRRDPLCVLRGARTPYGLLLQTDSEELAVRPEELLLVVSGPIVREPAPRFERRRIETACLQEGWCAHLHFLAELPPIELDPARIELGFTVTGSARLELGSWVELLARAVPHDEGFRRETPALAPSSGEEDPRLPWQLERRGAPAPPGVEAARAAVYDNRAQFRFYSGWRAAVERRRRGSRATPPTC